MKHKEVWLIKRGTVRLCNKQWFGHAWSTYTTTFSHQCSIVLWFGITRLRPPRERIKNPLYMLTLKSTNIKTGLKPVLFLVTKSGVNILLRKIWFTVYEIRWNKKYFAMIYNHIENKYISYVVVYIKMIKRDWLQNEKYFSYLNFNSRKWKKILWRN